MEVAARKGQSPSVQRPGARCEKLEARGGRREAGGQGVGRWPFRWLNLRGHPGSTRVWVCGRWVAGSIRPSRLWLMPGAGHVPVDPGAADRLPREKLDYIQPKSSPGVSAIGPDLQPLIPCTGTLAEGDCNPPFTEYQKKLLRMLSLAFVDASSV
jgi:hypothetical protein